MSGIGFARLTHKGTVMPAGSVEEVTAKSEKIPAKVFLSFSEPAGSVQLNSGDQAIVAGLPGNLEKMTWHEFSTEMTIEKNDPVIFLNVVWSQDSGNRRFAKLVVEAEGQETFTHVFDADGDIDDFVELPF
ncbi:MAG: hypothetical protein RLZZ505_1333 [Verrucomicrobiota bacterium]